MLVEEFKRCINSDIKSFLNEKQVETLKLQLDLQTITLEHLKFPLLISQIPLEDHFSHNQDPNIVLVIHLAVIAKHLLLNIFIYIFW